jgi:hypothetical protein
MYSYPVDVNPTSDGEYDARLADLADSPVGRGVDPYAALEDLNGKVRPILRKLYEESALPEPSPGNDRPTLDFDPMTPEPSDATLTALTDEVSDDNMIGYSWTNTTVFSSR